MKHLMRSVAGPARPAWLSRSVALLGGLSLLVACDYTGTAKAQDYCGQYHQLLVSIEMLQDGNPLSARADQLRQTSAAVETKLNNFQAVSEGRFDTVLATLRADLAAVKESAVKDGTDTHDTARPLVKDSLTNLSDSWGVVQNLAASECGSGS